MSLLRDRSHIAETVPKAIELIEVSVAGCFFPADEATGEAPKPSASWCVFLRGVESPAYHAPKDVRVEEVVVYRI